MSTHGNWMPQFNWPVFGPLLGIFATLALVGAVVGSRLWLGRDPPNRLLTRL